MISAGARRSSSIAPTERAPPRRRSAAQRPPRLSDFYEIWLACGRHAACGGTDDLRPLVQQRPTPAGEPDVIRAAAEDEALPLRDPVIFVLRRAQVQASRPESESEPMATVRRRTPPRAAGLGRRTGEPRHRDIAVTWRSLASDGKRHNCHSPAPRGRERSDGPGRWFGDCLGSRGGGGRCRIE